MAFVKLATREWAPLFMAGIRSLVASVCLYIWMKAKGLDIFPSGVLIAHGIQIEYDTFGDPFSPPLLLIMGLGGQRIHWNETFCRQLAERGHFVIHKGSDSRNSRE